MRLRSLVPLVFLLSVACGDLGTPKKVVFDDPLTHGVQGTPVHDAHGNPILPDDFPLKMPAGGQVLTSLHLANGAGWGATLRYAGAADTIETSIKAQLTDSKTQTFGTPDPRVQEVTLRGKMASGGTAIVTVWTTGDTSQATILCQPATK